MKYLSVHDTAILALISRIENTEKAEKTLKLLVKIADDRKSVERIGKQLCDQKINA